MRRLNGRTLTALIYVAVWAVFPVLFVGGVSLAGTPVTTPLAVIALLVCAGPFLVVGLVIVVANSSVTSHANREAKRIRTEKGERPAPLPHQQREAVR